MAQGQPVPMKCSNHSQFSIFIQDGTTLSGLHFADSPVAGHQRPRAGTKGASELQMLPSAVLAAGLRAVAPSSGAEESVLSSKTCQPPVCLAGRKGGAWEPTVFLRHVLATAEASPVTSEHTEQGSLCPSEAQDGLPEGGGRVAADGTQVQQQITDHTDLELGNGSRSSGWRWRRGGGGARWSV